MIYEYAVDPALVIDWVLKRDVGLAPQFGIDQRRLVSDIADDWQSEVHCALLRHFEWDSTDPEFIEAEQFMSALMEFLRYGPSRGLKRTNDPWMEQVLAAHQHEPFHAILTRDPAPAHEAVITPAVTRNVRDERWYLPTVNVTSKTAEALAEQLSPLLRLASRVVLVDPYFDPADEAYRAVLRAMLIKAASSRGPGRKQPCVEVISGVDHRQRGRESRAEPPARQWARFAESRCEAALQRLAPVVPRGMSVRFKCAAAFTDGDEVHNRYLLTDIGGACMPYGTDPLGENVRDDVTPMYAGQYRMRWKQYGKGEGLNVISHPVEIAGLM